MTRFPIGYVVTLLLCGIALGKSQVDPMIRKDARRIVHAAQAAAALPKGKDRDKAIAVAAAEGAKLFLSAPNDPVVATLTAQSSLILGDPKTAAARAETAVTLAAAESKPGAPPSPEFLDAVKTRAVAKWHLSDFPGAAQDALTVLKSLPKDPVANAVAKLSEDRVPSKLEGLVGPAAGSGEEGALPELALLAGRDPAALTNRPANFKKAVAYLNQGEQALQLGNYPEMHRLATVSLNLVPDNPKAYMQRAFADLFLKRPAAVVADATLGLALQPDSPELLGLRARGYNDLGKLHAAFADADRAITLDARHAMGWMERARSREGLREPAKAWLEDYQRAAELQPAWSHFYDEALARSQMQSAAGRGGAPTPPLGRGAKALIGAGVIVALAVLGILVSGWARVKTGSTAPAPGTLTPSSASPNAAADAKIAGRYVLGRLLGQGGMGKVFEARDTVLGRLVAVKQMREELRSSPNDLRRFLEEARTVASLAHPNIVAIHDVVEEGPYLVFELVQGRTLQQSLEALPSRKLEPALVRKVLEQACSALDHAHSRKVVHRDLKPSNIMMNDGFVVKLMDFGISRVAKDSLMRTTATIAGTPLYMAPEQETGKSQRETDLYSLAICAFEMLAGFVPFDGPAQLELKRSGKPARADLNPKLAAFFARALDADAGRRFHSGGELLAAFSEALN